MQKVMLSLMIMGIWSIPALAGEGMVGSPLETPRTIQPAVRNLWRVSTAAAAAANAMDVYSSWGKHELNPNLSGNDGRFGRQGALLKLGIVGGTFVMEALVLRHRPSAKLYRAFTFVNFGGASVTGATAIRNLGIPRQ